MKFKSYSRFYRSAMASEIAAIIRDFSKDPSFSVARFVSKPKPVPAPIRSFSPCANGVCPIGGWKPTRPTTQPQPDSVTTNLEE